jgi:hypothetical protein
MRDLTRKMICPVVFSALEAVVSRREALVFVDDHQLSAIGYQLSEVLAQPPSGVPSTSDS